MSLHQLHKTHGPAKLMLRRCGNDVVPVPPPLSNPFFLCPPSLSLMALRLTLADILCWVRGESFLSDLCLPPVPDNVANGWGWVGSLGSSGRLWLDRSGGGKSGGAGWFTPLLMSEGALWYWVPSGPGANFFC